VYERSIDAKTIKSLLLKVYRDFKRGDLSEAEAGREVGILNSILKAIEVNDLEERLQKIERALNE
jgi:hypothetical protein